MDNLPSEHQDAFLEIGNIGAGHAATALSQMLMRRIDISLPRVNVIDITNFKDSFPFDDQSAIAVIHSKTSGDVIVDLYAFIAETGIQRFLNLLTFTKTVDPMKLSEIEKSSLKEIGNILILHYVSSINTFISSQLFIYPEVPDLEIGKAKQLLEKNFKTTTTAGKLLSIDVDIYTDEDKIDALMVMVPSEETLENIISLLFEK